MKEGREMWQHSLRRTQLYSVALGGRSEKGRVRLLARKHTRPLSTRPSPTRSHFRSWPSESTSGSHTAWSRTEHLACYPYMVPGQGVQGVKHLSLDIFPQDLIWGCQASHTEKEGSPKSCPATASAAQARTLGKGSSSAFGVPPWCGDARGRGDIAVPPPAKGCPRFSSTGRLWAVFPGSRSNLLSAILCVHLQVLALSPRSGDWSPDLFLPPSSSSHPPLLPPATSEKSREALFVAVRF